MVVGVDALSSFIMAGFNSLKSLDPEGCRPFDRDRRGLTPGEAGAAMVLARADRVATPRGVIQGWGGSNDANHLTGPSRDGAGLARAIMRALKKAGARPEEIGYINAHGTGTIYNDAMESLAIATVFGKAAPPVSSSKGILGHTMGAAGVVESIICLLALESGVLPGTPRLRTRDEAAPSSLLEGPLSGQAVQRALKINTGFGGTNAALVIGA